MELVDAGDDEVAALIYTSGTTGKPKGVMHTHGSLLANAQMQLNTIKLPDGMTSIMVLPLCHSYGIASMNYGALRGGGRSVVLGSFDIDAVFQAIDKYKANMMGAVPTMYLFMLLHPEPEKYDFSSMKYWISGSAPWPWTPGRRSRTNSALKSSRAGASPRPGPTTRSTPWTARKKSAPSACPWTA